MQAEEKSVSSGMKGVTLVLGGARSGKSRHAEGLVTAGPHPWIYLATGRAFDDEMRMRIAQHRRERAEGWETVEEPVGIARVLDEAGRLPVLVDCLTLWLTNLILEDHDIPDARHRLMTALRQREGRTVLVGNEVGLGIVPENALARRFRDEAGILHQKIAEEAATVTFVAAGLPFPLKQGC